VTPDGARVGDGIRRDADVTLSIEERELEEFLCGELDMGRAVERRRVWRRVPSRLGAFAPTSMR
jgi:hypothetical protein